MIGLALSVGSSGQVAAAGPLPEDLFPELRGILEKALGQSPTMLLRNIDIAQAQATNYLTSAQLWPQLFGSVYYSTNTSSVSQNTSATSRSDGVFYSLSLSQPVFHWGVIMAQSQSAKIGIKIAESNFAEAYRLLAVSIRGQYLGLIVKKVALRNAQFALKVAEATLSAEEAKLRNGQISSGDIIGPRLAVDDARLAYERAEADLTQTARYFSKITGLETLGEENIPQEIPVAQSYYDTTQATGLLSRFEHADVENTFQAQSLRYGIKQAELNYKVAKFRLYPMINVSATVSQSNQTTASVNAVTQVGVNSQSASIAASWSIFDGFATKGAKLSALSTKRVYERQLADYLRTASDQARVLERQVNFAARAMQLADTRRALFADAVKRTTEDLSRGVGSQSAIDSATSTFYQYDLKAASGRADFLNNWAEYLSALGIDPVLKSLPSRYLAHDK